MSKPSKPLPHVRNEAAEAAAARHARNRPDGRPMDRNERVLHARAVAPVGQRQLVRFYPGADGSTWVEVVSGHDRTFVLQRPATPEDVERWASEYQQHKETTT